MEVVQKERTKKESSYSAYSELNGRSEIEIPSSHNHNFIHIQSNLDCKMTLPSRIFRPWDEPKRGCANKHSSVSVSDERMNGDCKSTVNCDETVIYPRNSSSSPIIESGKRDNFPFPSSSPRLPPSPLPISPQSNRVKKMKKVKKLSISTTKSSPNTNTSTSINNNNNMNVKSSSESDTKVGSSYNPISNHESPKVSHKSVSNHTSDASSNKSTTSSTTSYYIKDENVQRDRNQNDNNNRPATIATSTTICCASGMSPMEESDHLFPSSSDSPLSLHPSNQKLFLYPFAINELANMSRHELTAMGLLPPEPPSSAQKVKRQRPKRFHCPHCQVAFSNNGQLRGHIRIHTGERPFVCEQDGCDKSFTRNEELTRHRRIHSGLRPFPCSYCGKKFGRKDHLKKHTRTHQRVMYSTPSSMIGYGTPFQPFHPPILSSSPSSSAVLGASAMNELNCLSSLHPSAYSSSFSVLPSMTLVHPHPHHQLYHPSPL